MLHFHKYEVVDVNQKVTCKYYEGDPKPYVDRTFTIVLYKCSICGKCKAEEINGRWNSEQLRNETSNLDNLFKKRMGRG